MLSLNKNKSWLRGIALSGVAILSSANIYAASGPSANDEMSNPLAITLVIVMIGLLVAIALLGYVVIGAGRLYVDRLKEKQSSAAGKVITLFALCLISTAVLAADAPAEAATPVINNIGGLATSSFYSLVAIIGLELLVLLVLAFFLKKFIAKEKEAVVAVESKFATSEYWKNLWTKLNSFKPATEEANITLDHNYDGIRELDNRLPPWWLYGFYVCILFAFVYIYRFHVSHSAPSSVQEFELAMAQADLEKEEYLKKAANKVDENTVTLLTDASALAEGKKIFVTTCAACHGADAQGIVGPNLTDDYWLHKGGVKDVFKTIKYGVPEKGMKSWKDDFSPNQIAQLTSFIKSLHGTKPAGAKEPQGELFKEEQASVGSDSTKLAAK